MFVPNPAADLGVWGYLGFGLFVVGLADWRERSSYIFVHGITV